MGTYERAKNAPTADTADFADGTLAVPESSNGVPDVLDEARWELEWMMSMQVPAGSGEQLIDGTWRNVDGMVHHKVHDEGWTGLPLLPHTDPQVRSLHRPSTAATLNFAAVAAQGARLWAPYDEDFALRLLAAGKRAWTAARANPAIYAPAADGNEGGGPYNDSNVTDEFYWAAAELYITTGSRPYRDYVLTSVAHTADAFPDSGFSWDSMAALARLDLATVPNKLPGRAAVQQSVLDAADDLLAVQAGEPFGHPYAGDATGNYVWGSNSQVLNNMVVLGVGLRPERGRRLSRGGDGRHGLPPRPQLAGLVVRDRVRRADPQLGRPAQSLVRGAARPEPPAPADRQHLRRAELQLGAMGSDGGGAVRRAGLRPAALLHRRHPVVVDERDHGQLERPAGVGRQLPRRPGRRNRRPDS